MDDFVPSQKVKSIIPTIGFPSISVHEERCGRERSVKAPPIQSGRRFHHAAVRDRRTIGMSAIKVGQALDALHLRDQGTPTAEAASRGLGHRWFNGSQYLVEWNICSVTEAVTDYYDGVGNDQRHR